MKRETAEVKAKRKFELAGLVQRERCGRKYDDVPETPHGNVSHNENKDADDKSGAAPDVSVQPQQLDFQVSSPSTLASSKPPAKVAKRAKNLKSGAIGTTLVIQDCLHSFLWHVWHVQHFCKRC